MAAAALVNMPGMGDTTSHPSLSEPSESEAVVSFLASDSEAESSIERYTDGGSLERGEADLSSRVARGPRWGRRGRLARIVHGKALYCIIAVFLGLGLLCYILS